MLHAPANETKSEGGKRREQTAAASERGLAPQSLDFTGFSSTRGAGGASFPLDPTPSRSHANTLQQVYGNQALMRIRGNSAPMALLRPSQTGLLQRKCACGESAGGSGECAGCREKREETLQRRATDQTTPETVPLIVDEVLRSPGQPLDSETRVFMEPRFGFNISQMRGHSAKPQMAGASLTISSPNDRFEREADRAAETVTRMSSAGTPTHARSLATHDFSQVRVHTDAKAAESAEALNALAYTVGRDIVFGEAQYAPTSGSGRHLLAHELAHVAQQENTLQLNHIQRQEGSEELPGNAPADEFAQLDQMGESEDEDDVEDGDTDVPDLDETPDFELEPHGPEPMTDGSSSPVSGGAEQSEDVPLKIFPTGKIKHIDVNQVSQTMAITFRDGQKLTHTVSTGKGDCGTAGHGDPCKTQTEHHCTPNGTFLIVSRGNANTKNTKGDAMAWFVGMKITGRNGIGIHNSQTADGIPRSHGCVRVGKSEAEKSFAKMINEHVVVGSTDVTITGKAKTKYEDCPKKKKKP